MKVTAIVPAAGAGQRFVRKKGRRKPFFNVNKRPILIHTLLALERSPFINDIIVVAHRDDIAKGRAFIKRFRLKKVGRVVPGGKARFNSVKNGLSFVGASCDMVFIHDGVRPLVDKRIIADCIKACKKFDAAVCGVPVVSTIKFVDRNCKVMSTPDRKALYLIQTPQVFKRQIILEAYKRPLRPKEAALVTDDSALVERLGYKVKVVPGSYRNIKVTTPEDLIMAKRLLVK